MDANCYSQVHFFNSLRDTVVAQPYAILRVEEVNTLINKIDNLTKDANAQCLEYASDFRRAVDNAKNDGYYPIVVLPVLQYETALSLLK